jgi:hypothetical protein
VIVHFALAITIDNFAEDEYLPILQNSITEMQERAESEEGVVHQTPDEVAEAVLDVAVNSSPHLRIRTSEWAEEFCKLKTQADPDGMKLVADVRETFL